MKASLTLIVFLATSSISLSQLPMGEDIDAGAAEIKKLMAIHDFTYFKETEHPPEQGLPERINIMYKEEVEVDIYFNVYRNIEIIAFRTGNEKIIDRLKLIVGFDKWTYAYTRDNPEQEEVYQYGDYYCRLRYNPEYADYTIIKHKVYQFVNFY